jgi:hypothetical protein
MKDMNLSEQEIEYLLEKKQELKSQLLATIKKTN